MGRGRGALSAADLVDLLAGRRGHFLLESGHHGDLWLDVERLCLRPEAVRPFAGQLARRLAAHGVEAVCGPLVEGAFVALLVAAELGVRFTYSEPQPPAPDGRLYPVAYRVPTPLRETVHARRVAIVNDVINAGSAVRGTCADLEACGADVVAVASLAVLGAVAASWAADKGIVLETLLRLPNTVWEPRGCPLCAAGVPLSDERYTRPS